MGTGIQASGAALAKAEGGNIRKSLGKQMWVIMTGVPWEYITYKGIEIEEWFNK